MAMKLMCIKHPSENLTFDVCLKCLDNIPSEERADVIAAIRDEYELHNRLAEKCRTVAKVVNV